MRATRAAFVASALCTLPVAAARRAAAAETVRVGGTPANDIIGVLQAQRSGAFTRAGLEVELTMTNSGAAVLAAVLGGSYDIGKSSVFGLLTAYAKGAPIVLVAPAAVYTSEAPNTAIVVAKDSTLKTGRDLNGKTFAVPGLGDLNSMTSSAWIDADGGDSRSVKFLELPGPATADAIASGRVDASALTEPQLTEAIASGKCKIIGYPDDAIGRRLLVTAYFCTSAYAAKNAGLLARFRKAVSDAVAYANAHRSEMFPVIAAYSKLDVATVAKLTPALFAVPGGIDLKTVQPWIDAAVRYKAISKAFSARDMIDPGALS